jgi:lysophospholipase L1-like esterase
MRIYQVHATLHGQDLYIEWPSISLVSLREGTQPQSIGSLIYVSPEDVISWEAGPRLQAVRESILTATTYVVSGDSTRDNSYNEMISYYSRMLGKAGISVVDNAASGLRGEDWANNTGSATANQAIAAIPGDGTGTVWEFSLGINDTSSEGSETPQQQLDKVQPGIDAVLAAKPNVSLFFVQPVPVASTARNASMIAFYDLLAAHYEQHLVLLQEPMAAVYDGMDDPAARVFYEDGTHPNAAGSIRAVNFILSEVLHSSMLNTVTLDNLHWTGNTENVVETVTEVISGEYWNSSGTTSVGAAWARFGLIEVTAGQKLRITHQGSRDDVRLFGVNGVGDYLGVVATPDSGSAPGTYEYDIVDASVSFAGANITSSSEAAGGGAMIEVVETVPAQGPDDLTQTQINIGNPIRLQTI